MNLLYLSVAVYPCYANDNDAYIPEMWANEGLAILEENMVMARMVYRDFEDEVRNFGDVVNTRRPGTFAIRRKVDGDTLVPQDANATNVRVPLDQWFTTTFTIKDGEASLSFQDLVDIYLVPGMQTIARSVDRAIIGRIHDYLTGPTNRAGKLNGLTSTNSHEYVLEARQVLNQNKAPMEARNLVLSPASETALLQNTMFIKANERGDGGTALENATLGRILGFNTVLDQNVNAVTSGADVVTGTITNAASADPNGTPSSQACTVTGYEANVGEFATVVGNAQPTYLTAVTASTNTTAVTMHEGNKYATDALAVLTVYKACEVTEDYAVGWSKGIVLSSYTSGYPVQIGQLLAFGTGTDRRTYTVIESEENSAGTECTVYLDRPLEVAINGDPTAALAFPGPYGSLNWAFHREAIALVSRPLAMPNNNLGVMTKVGVHNDVAMRVSMQYNVLAGGTVVNLDLLCGVAVLDTRLCVPLLG
jgi:hypothetical protein